MERLPRERQYMGTSGTIAHPSIVKGISHSPPSNGYKNPPGATSKLSSSFPLPPHSKLEFHPYAYIDFAIPSPFPHTPCISMSDILVTPSCESPNTTLPQSPLPIPFNPVITAAIPTYPPLLPQMAINVLASQPDLNETVRAIAYGLISTVHNWEVLHALQSKGLQDTNTALQDCIKNFECKADRSFELPLRPTGYEDNNRRVTTQVPIGGGYYTDTKWIQQHNNGCINLLIGKDFDKEPYSTDLFLNPSYFDAVAAPLPCWFSNILTGPTPAYHALCKAVSDLDDWNAIAKVECYHCYNHHHHHLANKLSQLQCELTLVDDAIAASHHRMEVAQIPALVPNLEGRAFSLPHTGHRITNQHHCDGCTCYAWTLVCLSECFVVIESATIWIWDCMDCGLPFLEPSDRSLFLMQPSDGGL